jgi:nucleolar protein 56
MIAQDTEEAQAAIADYEKFSSMVKLVGFQRFETAESALEECNAVANGESTQLLVNFLELNLPKGGKKKASGLYSLGVMDPGLAANLGGLGFSVNHGQNIKETLRGCLMHFSKMSKDIKEEDLCRARCGLAHCFSRNKMQLDPNRQDKPIMNTIAILDSLDKNINTFAMRVREWYAWHFPELSKIIADNIVYAQVAKLIRVRDDFKPEENDNDKKLEEACGSDEIAEEIKKALKTSMGQDISEMDIANIEHFAHQVIQKTGCTM